MKTLCMMCLCLMVLAAPAFAAEPLSKGDQAIAFDAAWTKTDGESVVDLSGTWYRYTGENQRTGINLLFLDQGDVDGMGAGPSYDYLFRPMSSGQRWRIVVGGDVSFLSGDLGDAANALAVTRLGVEWEVGGGTAIRLMPRWITPINKQDPLLADQLEQYGLTLGILLGVKRATVN